MIAIILAFLKIGFLGFGGGYAMLSLIYQEAEQFGMTVPQFADLNALDGLIPGPIAINSATYVGQLYGGLSTALAATLAVSVPSLIIVPLYLHFEKKLNANRLFNSIISGIKPASVGLILAVAVSLAGVIIFGGSDFKHWQFIGIDWTSILVMGLILFLDLRYQLNPIWLLLIAGVIGGVSYYL
ncbi:chromate transporter [Lapidilactobacillus mulanensis]|uniref:Chromate transporter n=1 Tax=Lapidilactobacillus mulanensis TaxID=2485999 RepID=A0ABW4DPP2_9LACO|nr:chromate transporter [Lapidilactobacillus mulanensis]